MHRIEKSWLAIIPSALWGWILMFIPTIIQACRIAGVSYVISENQLLVTKGLLNKSQTSIDFYRIKNITSRQNVFGYGTIAIVEQGGATTELHYVGNPNQQTELLRNRVFSERKDQNIRVVEQFS